MRAARLTFVQGAVMVTPARNATSEAAQLNMPLLSGVQVATGSDGQAEVEFEDGSVARLTPNSALSLDALGVDGNGVFTTGLTLLQGLAYFELRATPQYRYSVNAGGDVLSPVENTTVRVNFDEPPATIAVLDGTAQVERQADATGSGYQTEVRAGESLRVDVNNGSRYFLSQQIDSDSWDQWNADMDQSAAAQAADSTAVRNDYAGAQGYGWSDLDANGSWYDVPGTGPVWQPNVAADDADFDPYGNGAWIGYPGGGYLWASAYPWGWTPYRCGVWSYYGGFGWGWVPGVSCGGLGWGFFGGGTLVNIAVFPSGYRPIRVPVAHPGGGGGWRPILPVHGPGGVKRGPGTVPVRSGLRIGGVAASRIGPIGRDAAQHDGSAGASLRRDFPVDSRTRTPVMGLASTRPAMVRGKAGEYTTGQQRPGSVQVQTVQPQSPANGGQSIPATGDEGRRGRGIRGDQPAAGQGQGQGQGQRQSQQNSPAQRGPDQPLAPTIYPSTQPEHRVYSPPVGSSPNAPSQPQPEHRMPPQNAAPSAPTSPQPEHRGYTPPAGGSAGAPQPEHRTYTPPAGGTPAPQPEHRSYTPPPSSAPAPSRPSAPPPPPPPPPAAAPSRPSSPPPSAPAPNRTAPK